jgi:hypothetical protein
MIHSVGRRKFLWLVGTAALSTVLRRGALAGGPVGSVVGAQGASVVEGQGGSRPLRMGDAVAVSDTIAVPADGRLKLRMSDRTVISLASDTRMTISDYQANSGGQRESAQLTVTQGMARLAVAPADRPLQVATPVGTATARTADLFIEARTGSAQCGVLTGSVSLTSAATGHSVTIPARRGARLEAGRDPVPARTWAPQEFQTAISRTDVP